MEKNNTERKELTRMDNLESGQNSGERQKWVEKQLWGKYATFDAERIKVKVR